MSNQTPQVLDQAARWLVDQIKQEGWIKQEEAVRHIAEHFGEELVSSTQSGHSLDKKLLRAFRQLKGNAIRWNPGHHAWQYQPNGSNGEENESQVPRAVQTRPVPENAGLDHPSLYLNRELSWLDFNWRVYFQAADGRLPLLDRIRFVAITSSNLDEFIQKRLGGLKRQEAAGVHDLSPDGRSPSEQIDLIQQNSYRMQRAISQLLNDELIPALREEAGIKISNYSELNKQQQEELDQYFDEHIYPILTPLAVDPGHPFPFISNLSLSLAVLLHHPKRSVSHFARVKIPSNQHRFQRVTDDHYRYHFVPIEQVVKHNVQKLFRGMDILEVTTFRVTRNADIRREEEEADDLISMISEELRERRFAPVVRLEIEEGVNKNVLDLLRRELGLTDSDIIHVKGWLDPTDCFELYDLPVNDFKFQRWEPVIPKRLQHEGETEEEQTIFDIIKKGDLLVHHPYESFSASVQRLIAEAADDPKVIAIKQTLYRTSDDSPVVKALTRAADKGKQVAVLVEVKARFDEANNIEWGKMLENAGVHVTYGLVGLKTHAKVALVIREEDDGPVAYCHIGTGNYHVKTAGMYTDLGLLTRDPSLGRDVINLFHFLTGISPHQDYEKLLVAPVDMRSSFYELIDQEIHAQRTHGNGRIIAKMNALDDLGVIQKLYEASREGVSIDLIIRGHTRLRPGVTNISENIRVISIIGRFLEHDRIFYFANNQPHRIFIGSADWRNRNLSERVEAVVPITQQHLEERILHILDLALTDNRLAWDLNSDGSYIQRSFSDANERNFHKLLMDEAKNRAR